MKKGGIRTFEDAPVTGVNIVPVIDLCLVLLVVLLIISPMLDKPPVEVALPRAETKEEKENNITVTVARPPWVEEVRCSVEVAEALPPWFDKALWMAWPAVPVALYLSHQYLRKTHRAPLANRIST